MDTQLTLKFCRKRQREQYDYLLDLLKKATLGEITIERYKELFDSAFHRYEFFMKKAQELERVEEKKPVCLCHPNDLMPFGECVYGKCLAEKNVTMKIIR
jgi:hypothetical protein